MDREYGLWAHDDYDPNRAKALVFIYHGNTNLDQLPVGLNGRGFFGMEAVVDRDAILLYVDAKNLSQDPDFVSWETLDVSDENPDIQLFQAIVDDVRNNYCVDERRTFAIGFSGGANFVTGLACQHAELVTGIATYAGGFEERHGGVLDLATCDDVPTSALSIHNVFDGVAPVSESDNAVDYFAQAAGCATTTSATALPECLAFDGCVAGTQVVQCRQDEPADPGQAHDVWQPEGPPFVWDFFQSL